MTPLPAWIDREAWDAFEAMRREIRKPLTPRGTVRVLKRLQAIHDAGQDANEALDQSSDMRWQDVYPVKALDIAKPAVSGYEATQARLRAEAARQIAPPPARVLAMVSKRRAA
jgi:CheY-like chemotaxis protein